MSSDHRVARRFVRPRPWIASAVACLALSATGCGVGRVLVPFAPPESSIDVRFARRLDELWLETLDRAPERATRIGPVMAGVMSTAVTGTTEATSATRWDARAERSLHEATLVIEDSLARLDADFDARDLTPKDARSLARAKRALRRELAHIATTEPPRPHAWSGTVTTAPSFLANLQPARDVDDLRRWIARLAALTPLVDFETAEVEARRGAARLPRPILEATLELLGPIATGAPSDPLLEPFEGAAAQLPPAIGESLARRARQVVREELRPAYARLVAALESERGRAGEVSGAWRTAETEAAYLARLAEASGPGLDPLLLHELGRAEIQRLHGALRSFADESRDLAAWFDVLRANPSAAPGFELGERAPLELWTHLQPLLPELVQDAHADAPTVSRAHAWDRPRGRWSPFVPASADGTRRARLLVASAARTTVPVWQREFHALRYGLPGRALFDLLTNEASVPRLLAFAEEDAHAEGWSLWLALSALEEIDGLERDAGFARLASELVEAATLVVDTGLHARRWTRAQAVDFLRATTPLPNATAEELVLRIAAEPGRAAAPYLGLMQLEGLERRAMVALGPRYRAPELRRALVDEGVLAPEELDELVERWIADRVKAGAVEPERTAGVTER